MKRQVTHSTLYVPTLVDDAALRHIIPSKDAVAYCGATGSQCFPHDHKVSELCVRCLQKYMRVVLDIRLGEAGL